MRSCRVDLNCTVSPGMPAQPTQSFVGTCLFHRSPLFHAFAKMTCAAGFHVFPKVSRGELYKTSSHFQTTSSTVLPAKGCLLVGRLGSQSERSRVWGSDGTLRQIIPSGKRFISLTPCTWWGSNESSDPQGKVWVSFRSQRKGSCLIIGLSLTPQ